MDIPIYTIGYGNRSMEEFIKLLKQYGIEYLVDVRSQPYSRYKPEFSKETLEKHVKQAGIRYLFMGDTLGGRPADETCYLDGRVDYVKVQAKSFFQEGIRRLQTAWQKQLRVAVMCSETKPQECHRSKLIGNTLIDNGIKVTHIDEGGRPKTQEEINNMLTNNIPTNIQPPLFEEPLLNRKVGFSRKKYLPGERT